MGMRHLRALALVLAALGWVFAMGADRLPRIAYLGLDSKMQALTTAAFIERMRVLGYVHGRTITLDQRSAEGRFERLPALATELVALKPDVIVTAGPQAIRAVQSATTTIPTIVVTSDPVGSGFVESLARPGGMFSGIAFQDWELSAKRIDLLRQLVPEITRIAIIWHREGRTSDDPALRALGDAVRPLGMTLRAFEVKQGADLPAAVAAAKSWGAQGLVQLASPTVSRDRRLLIDAAARYAMPMLCEERGYVLAGCLASYSASMPAMFAEMADQVDRLLRGARVQELPMQQPREFELVVNGRTARELGLTITPTIRWQATEVLH